MSGRSTGGLLADTLDNAEIIGRALFSKFSSSETPPQPQPMKIIGAGFGRTGTSSLMMAFQRLGLVSYHMREGVIESNHGALWANHAYRMMALPNAGADASLCPSDSDKCTMEVEAILAAMAAGGFNATTDFPACLLLPELLSRYVNAKVVLSVRDSGDAWATSVLSTIARIVPIMSHYPFTLIQHAREFVDLNVWIWKRIGAPVEEATLLPKHEDLAHAHDEWIERVRFVTGGNLLVHKSKDGWGPLCEFLSSGPHADPMVKAKCTEVLAWGEPYPHINDTREMQRMLTMLGAIQVSAFVVPVLVLVFMVWRCVFARTPPRTKAD